MKTFRGIIVSLCIVFFAVCCGAMLLSHWSAFGWKALAIPTGSMRPAIPPGSLVLVHRVPISSLKVGDVITYTNPIKPGSTITHRILKNYKIDGNMLAFVTKGDANPTADRPIIGGLVIGQVAWHFPKLGKLLLWTKTWTGIAVIIYVPSLFITVEEIQRLNKFFKQSQPYKFYADSKKSASNWSRRWAVGFSALLVILFVAGVAGSSAVALLKSNTVALTNNRITVAARSQCSSNTSNYNNVTVVNNISQTASSGSSTSSGNTNGGSVNSGNSSNSNSTSVTVTVNNC